MNYETIMSDQTDGFAKREAQVSALQAKIRKNRLRAQVEHLQKVNEMLRAEMASAFRRLDLAEASLRKIHVEHATFVRRLKDTHARDLKNQREQMLRKRT